MMKRIPSGRFGLAGWTLATCLGAGLCGGCKDGTGTPHPEDDHPDHAHEGGIPTVQVTVFGERHEIFAEYPAPVAGAPTPFLTHITDLQTAEPRREGPVRFQLAFGQEPPVEQVDPAPLRPGIYETTLTFPKPGDWVVRLSVPTENGEQTLTFPSVRVFSDTHAAEHAEVPPPPDGISFLKEQQWRVHTRTESVTRRTLVEQLRLPATVAARPGNLAQITLPVAGRLLPPPNRPLPLVGDPVEAGQTLALVQPSFSEVAGRFVEAEAEVARAQLALEQAELALERTEKLAKAEAKSGRELQEAQFALRSARARHQAALALQATYRLTTTSPTHQTAGGPQPAIALTSPIAGTVIAQSGAAVGEYLATEAPVFTVLDASTVFIEAQVPEARLQRLGATRAARYALPGSNGPLTPITGEGGGRCVFLGIQVDPATRSVPLIYELKNPEDRLRVGQSLDLYVATAQAEEAVALPRSAIVEEAGRPIAFVQVSGETFQKRDLTLGVRDGDWVQVLAGVAEGERVATQGAYAIRLASVSATIPSHGHAH